MNQKCNTCLYEDVEPNELPCKECWTKFVRVNWRPK